MPTATVSCTDFVANVSQDVTVEQVNEAFREAAAGYLKGILEYCSDPLVSSDFKNNRHSCIFDALSTIVMQKRMVKILGWYDNEWGYSCRTADLCAFMSDKGM